MELELQPVWPGVSGKFKNTREISEQGFDELYTQRLKEGNIVKAEGF